MKFHKHVVRHHWKLQDADTSLDLWVSNSTNARGQLTNGSYGNNIIVNNQYDNFGFPTLQTHSTANETKMQLSNNFEPTRGLLQNKSSSLFNLNESFQYGTLDRLTHVSLNGNLTEEQAYDNKWRVIGNQAGYYQHENTAGQYQNTKIEMGIS